MLNLDSMSIEELLNLYDDCNLHIRIASKKYGLSVKDMRLYKNYAMNKAVAMKQRITGNLTVAFKYEAICESIYSRMTVKQW